LFRYGGNPQKRVRIAQIWRPASERAETSQVWRPTQKSDLEQSRYGGHPLERAGTVQVRRLPTRETSISSAIEDLFITLDYFFPFVSVYVCTAGLYPA
jgi:hypothetical protein